MKFPPEFVHWISLCITSASFSVQVNGELAGYFQSARGLRQGCSLSPYLFVICMDVLSKLLDRAAARRQFGYHPGCKIIGLTHLSFADDIMVFTDGRKRSVEGIFKVFDEFAIISGLQICMAKSMMFLAGVSNGTRQELFSHCPLEIGALPVRYLGLPLVTKHLSGGDYLPLVEQTRTRIASWTARSLSFAGRLCLIGSVLRSISNFWMTAFRLPRECIRELDQICSAFLWSGIELNTRKAKIAWVDVCKPKVEGGLGLRSLKETNDLCCLKLIWRIISDQPSLWVKWVKTNLLKLESLWATKENTCKGSWMWRKLLKYRTTAKELYRVHIRNGEATSFWYDKWSALGCLMDLVGVRGTIDMGIKVTATVAEAWSNRRWRRHRLLVLNDIETVLHTAWETRVSTSADIVKWRGVGDKFKPKFTTKDTWNHIRNTTMEVMWHKGIWFTHATPKFSFCTWLALHNRLSTGDRMMIWYTGACSACVLCECPMETRDHLFFSCRFSTAIWSVLAKKLLNTQYSTDWQAIVTYINDKRLDRLHSFLVRYVFQASIHTIWSERNSRRNGKTPNPSSIIIQYIDKLIRNRLQSIRNAGDRRYEAGLQTWFSVST